MPSRSVHLVAGARPNLMKIAPLYRRLMKDSRFEISFVYTGQHYDREMSSDVMEDLELPSPNYELGVGSGSHAEQTAAVLVRYEKLLLETNPDLVVVVGDVNSTLAAALAAKKLGIKVAHLEAGLRSFDRSMPEEINRLATDAIADFHWTPSPDANENLMKEGVAESSIAFVGNIMIEAYLSVEEKIKSDKTFDYIESTSNLAVLTVHRPSNVDKKERLEKLVTVITELARKYQVVFPVHPRTKARLVEFGLYDRLEKTPGIRLLPPLSYVPFMALVRKAAVIVTDSGGVQEESSYLGIPCFTLRSNTERPITLTEGTNRLAKIETLLGDIEKLPPPTKRSNGLKYWDGDVSRRIVDEMVKSLELNKA